jgi:hypothetical protein
MVDFDLSYLENLLLNMSAGLLPINLSRGEIEMLIEKYGPDWFEKLGYTEPEYEKPDNPTKDAS